MARFKIEITQDTVGQWVRFNVPSTSTGIPTWAVNQVVGAISISDSATGEDSQPLVKGGTLIAGSTIYAKANTPTTAVANDFFFNQRIALMGSGGGGGGGTTSYTFAPPLSESGGRVNLLTRSDLQLSSGSLTLNLTQNTDFRNALLAIDDAKRVATLTEVGRVKPTAGNFTITADGDMALDLSPTGALAQNFAPISIATDAVKVTNENQDIDGYKNFLKELKAEGLVATENGASYGAVDIRNQDGYFSISEDGGVGATQLLAAAGFIDTTTTFRIRNLAGGVVTFNTLAQYESTLNPTDDKDLVPLATLNSVKQELLNRINSLPTGIQWIGEIQNTSTEVTADPSLLTAFVQTQKQRTPQNGDFIRTSDSHGFIYSQNAWVDFGQISISIATTTSAGIMMFGTNDGELKDLGDGKAKVIGWDTVKQALQSLDTRINSKADASSVVKLTGDQSIAGAKTFTGGITSTTNITVSKSSPTIEFYDTTGNKQSLIGTIDNGANLALTPPSGGAIQFNGRVRYNYASVPTVTNNNEIPSLGQIKNQFAGLGTANTFTQDQTFSRIVFNERLRFSAATMSLAPSTNVRGQVYLSDGSIGSDCIADLNLANLSKIINTPDPTNAADVANKRYVDSVAPKVLAAGSTPTTADIGVAQVGYVLRR